MPAIYNIAMPEANWYPDPDRQGMMRYWDGSAWTDRRREAEMKVDEVIKESREEAHRLDRRLTAETKLWEQRLGGGDNWQRAQRNKGVSTVEEVSIFDNGKREQSSIFDSDQSQQLWGESDQPNLVKQSWHKVPRSWRKPILTVALIAFLIWVLPSLINLATTVLDLNEKRMVFNSINEEITDRPQITGRPQTTELINLSIYVDAATKPGYYLQAGRSFNLYQCKIGLPVSAANCQLIDLGRFKKSGFVFSNNLELVKGKEIRPSGATRATIIARPEIAEGDTSCFAIIWQGRQGVIYPPQFNCSK